jgi:hypothetical protein
MKELRERIRALPEGSPERAALIEDAKAVRREAMEQRRERRAVLRRFRRGCRNC